MARTISASRPAAKDGLNAVVQQGPFAVVVSDFRMPGLNGIQLLSEVKRANADGSSDASA